MVTSELIHNLREETGMNRKTFAEYFGIPLRTVEDWEAGRRNLPEYLLRLLAYRIHFEKPSCANYVSNPQRNVNVIKDPEGNSIVVINDICFKGKRSVNWKDVRAYLKQYVGEFYSIADTNDIIYIGTDFPAEYSASKYTISLMGQMQKRKRMLHRGYRN